MIEARDTCFCGRYPEPPQVIEIKSTDKPLWYSISVCERGEVALRVPQKAALIKSNPEVARCIFTKSGRRRTQDAVGRRVALKGFGRSLPTSEHLLRIAKGADPDVAARIFKEAENLVGR